MSAGLELGDREMMHSGAMERYWRDAEFHARVRLVWDILGLTSSIAGDRHAVIYTLFIDDLTRERMAG